MVEYSSQLDSVFGSLADPTRRDILRRVAFSELTISEIANPYDMSLAAVSKHIKILERAGLIVKRRKGKRYLARAVPGALAAAEEFLEQHRQLSEDGLET